MAWFLTELENISKIQTIWLWNMSVQVLSYTLFIEVCDVIFSPLWHIYLNEQKIIYTAQFIISFYVISVFKHILQCIHNKPTHKTLHLDQESRNWLDTDQTAKMSAKFTWMSPNWIITWEKLDWIAEILSHRVKQQMKNQATMCEKFYMTSLQVSNFWSILWPDF